MLSLSLLRELFVFCDRIFLSHLLFKCTNVFPKLKKVSSQTGLNKSPVYRITKLKAVNSISIFSTDVKMQTVEYGAMNDPLVVPLR